MAPNDNTKNRSQACELAKFHNCFTNKQLDFLKRVIILLSKQSGSY